MMNERRLKTATLASLLALILGGSTVQYPGVMPSGIPQLSSETQRTADRSVLNIEMRIGKVVTYDGAKISVLIGGSVIPSCAYVRQYQPILGDYVVLIHQGSQWVVTGALAGSPVNNAVQNPSFEIDAIGSSPSTWGRAHDGTSTANNVTMTVQATTGSHPLNGNQALDLSIQDTSGVGNKYSLDYIYSAPFSVVAGETWAVSAWVKYVTSQSFGLITPNSNVSVDVWWFADPTTVPPAAIGSSGYSPALFGAAHPSWVQLMNPIPNIGSVVPSGATYGRVIIRCETNISAAAAAFADIYIDLVTAQKIKNADGTYAP